MNVEELHGFEIVSVLIGSHFVRLNLVKPSDGRCAAADEAAIDIEAGFDLNDDGFNKAWTNDMPPNLASCLTITIGHSVSSSLLLDNGSLQLELSGGMTLILIRSSQGFESFHIHLPSGSRTF